MTQTRMMSSLDEPVKMVNVGDADPAKLGDFCWRRRERTSLLVKDSDEGVLCLIAIVPGPALAILPVEPAPEWLNGGVHWEWDGNENEPTLHPSIDGSKHGGWHGWIQNGEMK